MPRVVYIIHSTACVTPCAAAPETCRVDLGNMKMMVCDRSGGLQLAEGEALGLSVAADPPARAMNAIWFQQNYMRERSLRNMNDES